jgi:hypothetical protein
MGGKSAPPPPDYTPLMNAQVAMSQEQAAVSREQLAWAKETWAADRVFATDMYNISKPIVMAQAATALGNAANQQKILDIQARDAQSNSDFAQQQQERYKTVFQPMEDSLVQDAKTYDSPQKIDELRGRAMGDVSDQFDQTRTAAAQRLESYGIDPGQTRAGALDVGVRTAEAAAKAGAGETARVNAENTGRALRGEAINIGKGYPGQVAQAEATASGMGQGLVGNVQGAGKGAMAGSNDLLTQRLASSASGNQLMGNPSTWMAGARGSLSDAASTQYNGYQNQLASWKATEGASGAGWGGAGQLLGMAGGMFMMAKGGKFAPQQNQGAIPTDPADPAGKKDRFNVALSGGEYIVPKSAVDRLGTKHLDQLVAKHGDNEAQQAALARLKTGKPGGTTRGATAQTGAIPLTV